jgi:hypothetical protein
LFLADEIDNDGFTVVSRKSKPLLPLEPSDPAPTHCPHADVYHPDFAQIRSPSDTLFQTQDGLLFWFSLSLLVHHSTYFARVAYMCSFTTLEPASIIHLDIDSDTFALVARALLFDYTVQQRLLMYENPKETVFSPDFIDEAGISAGAVKSAIQFAKLYRFKSFRAMLQRLIHCLGQ